MKNGYKFFWTDHALSELKQTITYLKENWSEKEIKNFAEILEEIIDLIERNPKLFPIFYKKKNVRRAVVEKHNNLYYLINKDTIEILSLFSNRQNPKKIKI